MMRIAVKVLSTRHQHPYTRLLELKLGLIETMEWVNDPHEPGNEGSRKMRLEMSIWVHIVAYCIAVVPILICRPCHLGSI
jgi:hypothetical protein